MTNIDYLYNPDAAKSTLDQNHFVDKPLGYRVIEHGMILPVKKIYDDKRKKWLDGGGIADNNGEYVNDTLVVSGIGDTYTPPPPNQFNTAPILSFTVAFLFLYGVMSSPIIFAASGS